VLLVMVAGLATLFLDPGRAQETAPAPPRGNELAALAGLSWALTVLEASLLFLLEPALNPIRAWALHGGAPGAWAVVGGVLILGAGVVTSRAQTLGRVSLSPAARAARVPRAGACAAAARPAAPHGRRRTP